MFSEINPINKTQPKPFSFPHPEGRMMLLHRGNNSFLKLCNIHYKMLINQAANFLFDMMFQIVRDYFVVKALIFPITSS